jgi:hypothetical protein
MSKIGWVDEEIPSILSSATMEERERRAGLGGEEGAFI